ncbi:MAG: hypothetical protein U0Y82_07040 [Thermoleophilia bacterium]
MTGPAEDWVEWARPAPAAVCVCLGAPPPDDAVRALEVGRAAGRVITVPEAPAGGADLVWVHVPDDTGTLPRLLCQALAAVRPGGTVLATAGDAPHHPPAQHAAALADCLAVAGATGVRSRVAFRLDEPRCDDGAHRVAARLEHHLSRARVLHVHTAVGACGRAPEPPTA